MTKIEFLSALRDRLASLSAAEDLDRSLEYYSESIDDRMEDGLTEEEAVEAMGSIDEIVSQILMGAPPPRPVKEKAKKQRTWGAGVIALLILGFPLWFPLLAAFAAIVFSLYVLFWSMIAVFYAVDVSFAAGAVAGVFGSIAGLFTGHAANGLFLLGAGLVCLGLAILWFFACNATVKGLIGLSKTVLSGIKSCFVKKRGNV